MSAETIELALGDAKNLARGMQYAEAIPGLAHSFEALTRAIDEAENPSVFEALRRGWDEGFERGTDRAHETRFTRPRPRWDYVAKAITRIEAEFADDVGARSRVDALGAYVRDTFDGLGLSVHDADTLYVAVTTAGLLVEMANNGRAKGQVEPETVLAIANIAQSFTAALIDYLPPEARR